MMGQKVNPIGFRLGVNRTWDSRWFADSAEYAKLLHEDFRIREYLRENLKQAGISRIIIERPHKKCRVTVYTARRGMRIGKKGADIEVLRKKIAQMTDSDLHLNIVEVRKPELDAQLVRLQPAGLLVQEIDNRLLANARHTLVGVMDSSVTPIAVDMHARQVASEFEHHDLVTAPVGVVEPALGVEVLTGRGVVDD